jgi:phosphoribosyl-AMP cyclohydrolase
VTSDAASGPDFSRGDGLVPAIVQDAATGEVLMMAWMNREAYDETLRTGQTVFYSRSRGRLWRKGEKSGHVQKVVSVRIDCDADTILVRVEQTGAACHEGYKSCFFREVTDEGLKKIAERVVDPKDVYGDSHNGRAKLDGHSPQCRMSKHEGKGTT